MAGITASATSTGISARITGGSGSASAAPEQVIPGSRIDIRKWVLMDFTASERDGWLPDLLRAMADEAPLLAAHDEGSFMSRVAHLAPAPKTETSEAETGTGPDGKET